MFTGIVAERGVITDIVRDGDSARLTVSCQRVLDGVARGDSIAVSGVCLTVVAFTATEFSADVMAITLATSTLGRAHVGDEVNLESAVRAGEPLGGHFVQGHVDATVTVRSIVAADSWRVLRCVLPAELAALVARKGSIALNGVSLTVSDVGHDDGDLGDVGHWFEVSLIPETLLVTNLCTIEEGDDLNIETDILARHLQRLVAVQQTGGAQ